jgi:hypothetical protein
LTLTAALLYTVARKHKTCYWGDLAATDLLFWWNFDRYWKAKEAKKSIW